MRLDVGLAARCVAAETNFLCRKRRSSPAEDTLKYCWSFLNIKCVELLHNVCQFNVFLQIWLLIVGVVALWAPHHTRVFGPGLAYASPAKVVFTRQLYRFHEHMQTDGTNKFLLKAVFPVLRHDDGFNGESSHREQYGSILLNLLFGSRSVVHVPS